MTDMPMLEIIRALDLLGTVHRNKKNNEPKSSIVQVRKLISGGAGLTLSEWIEDQRLRSTSNERKNGKADLDEGHFQRILKSLNEIGLEEAQFDRRIAELNAEGLKANAWRRLSWEYAGKKATSGIAARRNIVEYFAASVRLAKRRSMLQSAE